MNEKYMVRIIKSELENFKNVQSECDYSYVYWIGICIKYELELRKNIVKVETEPLKFRGTKRRVAGKHIIFNWMSYLFADYLNLHIIYAKCYERIVILLLSAVERTNLLLRHFL
jgi:hypothetical protein